MHAATIRRYLAQVVICLSAIGSFMWSAHRALASDEFTYEFVPSKWEVPRRAPDPSKQLLMPAGGDIVQSANKLLDASGCLWLVKIRSGMRRKICASAWIKDATDGGEQEMILEGEDLGISNRYAPERYLGDLQPSAPGLLAGLFRSDKGELLLATILAASNGAISKLSRISLGSYVPGDAYILDMDGRGWLDLLISAGSGMGSSSGVEHWLIAPSGRLALAKLTDASIGYRTFYGKYWILDVNQDGKIEVAVQQAICWADSGFLVTFLTSMSDNGSWLRAEDPDLGPLSAELGAFYEEQLSVYSKLLEFLNEIREAAVKGKVRKSDPSSYVLELGDRRLFPRELIFQMDSDAPQLDMIDRATADVATCLKMMRACRANTRRGGERDE